MILVDKSIKERSGEIFCEGYAEKYPGGKGLQLIAHGFPDGADRRRRISGRRHSGLHPFGPLHR